MPTPSLADTAASPFQHGTQVEVRTSAGWAPATIVKRKGRKVLPEYGHGYERVRFADGREMAVCDFRAPTNQYPDDPPLRPIAERKLRDERIIQYEHAIFAVVQPDGSFEVARLD